MERKFLIADDHGLYRYGLIATLSNQFPQVTMLEAQCGNDVFTTLQQHNDIDLVLLDLRLPDMNGFQVLRKIRSLWPSVAVVILSAEDDCNSVKDAMANGARGFISKASRNEVVLGAIQLILAGEVYVPHLRLHAPPQKGLTLVKNNAPKPASVSAINECHLTPRQIDVLRLIVEGYSNKEICGLLNLSIGTIKTHCNAIFRDLNVTNRMQAAQAARRMQLL